MSLYVVHHQHPADRCPARNPGAAAMLLHHLSAENARRFGVAIRAEAVVDNAHTLYLIVEAPDQASVHRFMEPFVQAGRVDVWPASPCEVVVQRGGCEVAAS